MPNELRAESAGDKGDAARISAEDRFNRAIAGFDAANAEDPNSEIVDGQPRPKELVYSERMTAMLARLAPDASQVLRLATRCQHIQRWKIPRSDYPMDRIGYLQWRKRLNKFHAQRAGDILRDAGYDDATTARVGALLKKESLKSDSDAQTLEDAVALVFLESYLASFVHAHGEYDPAKFADILAKTAKKMSARGRAAAVSVIVLPPALAPVVKSAMNATQDPLAAAD